MMNQKKVLKTPESQIRAIQNYRKRNPEASRIRSYRTTARTFVRHHASIEDMEELNEIFKNENPNMKNKKEREKN